MENETSRILDQLKPIYKNAKYLQAHDYCIIPVNPNADEILGERSYPTLLSIPDEIIIDVVQIFRKSEDVPPIVENAIAVGAESVWMQVDIMNEEAAEMAQRAGLQVVMDRCMRATHGDLKATGKIA
ncbi:MAG: CoA-binding protein [Chloroflexi bacterium]|nr:MAG: CoA-binding protein [Chloroflexota bacterium]